MAKQKKQHVQITERHEYSGIIPDSSELKHLSDIDPDLPSRVIKMTEDQLHHQQEIERYAVKKEYQIKNFGQYFGFTLGILALYFGYDLMRSGKDLTGYATIITAIGGLVWASRKRKT